MDIYIYKGRIDIDKNKREWVAPLIEQRAVADGNGLSQPGVLDRAVINIGHKPLAGRIGQGRDADKARDRNIRVRALWLYLD